MTLRARYESLLLAGDLHIDPAQTEAVQILQDFADKLDGYAPPAPGLWTRLRSPRKHAREWSGLYLYGDVGRGKSMLMDLFFESVHVEKKRRVHFHQFMLEIHERLHKLQSDRVDDILPSVAREIADETWLLCFDEFHVGNIADAMILGRLFAKLFEAGVIIVATSNWPPDELYKNGLQRDRFLPFIDLINQKMVVYRLAGATDHRYEHMRGLKSYFFPLGDEATKKLQGIFLQLTGDAAPDPIALRVQGRTLNIVHAARGVGFFNFEELCGGALGPADYLAIAECLHTVILDGVPRFKSGERDITIRFMTLIDALYEAKVKFFMAADAPLERLAPTGDQSFVFQRTTSRLAEMQGEDYRHKAHLG